MQTFESAWFTKLGPNVKQVEDGNLVQAEGWPSDLSVT